MLVRCGEVVRDTNKKKLSVRFYFLAFDETGNKTLLFRNIARPSCDELGQPQATASIHF